METNINQAISSSWQVFKSNWKFLYQAYVLVLLVNIVLRIPSGVANTIIENAGSGAALAILVSLVFSLILGIVTLLLNAGLIKIHADVIRENKTQLSELYTHKEYIIPLFVASLLVGLGFMLVFSVLIALAAIVGFLLWSSNQAAALGIGSIIIALTIVGVIYWSIRLQFMAYLVVDQDLPPLEAISKSFAITKGHLGALLLFGLAVFVLNLIGVLALFLGLLISIPVTRLAHMIVYDQLLRQYIASQASSTKSSARRSS